MIPLQTQQVLLNLCQGVNSDKKEFWRQAIMKKIGWHTFATD